MEIQEGKEGKEGKETQLVDVNRIKPPYKSIICNEEPCVEFEDNRKKTTLSDPAKELKFSSPVDIEHPNRKIWIS